HKILNMSLLGLVALLLDELDTKPSEAAKLSPTAAWWTDTDGLVAVLNGIPTSLNLADICLSHSVRAEVEEHQKTSAKRHFWKELLSRYENRTLDDEQHLSLLESPSVDIKLPINQPAFEYVEDI